MVIVDVTTDLKLDEIEKILKSNMVGQYVSGAVHRQYTPSMPMNTGNFSQQIKFEPWKYTHLMPYSTYVYNKNMNFRTDKHPFAMANYIEGFSSVARPKIERELANFIKSKVVK